MPEYLIANTDEMTKYALVKPTGITWGRQADATGYGTPQAAREAFDKVVDLAMSKAKAKADAALTSGEVQQQINSNLYTNGHFYKTRERQAIEEREQKSPHRRSSSRWEHSVTMRRSAIELFVPLWMAEGANTKASSFPVASRASRDDLLGVHELFYVCGASGWLCRPETKAQAGVLTFGHSFALAVSFASREAAQVEISKHRADGCSIVKSTCVFTQVITPPGAGAASTSHPEIVAAIASACEARDITGSIEQSARERQAAMNDAAPAKSRSRL